MLSSLLAGLRAAVRQPWLASLLWAWSAALSLAAALPAAVWLWRGLSLRPRGDVLLDGFSWDVLKELLHYDASPVFTLLWWAAAGALLLAALGSALVNGGLLEVLWPREAAPDPRPRLHRFFRGAGRYLLVNLRVLLLSSVPAAVAIVALLAVLAPVSEAVADTQREGVAWLDLLLPLAVVAVVVVVWGTVADFARLRVVALDSPRAASALWWALRFVLRHPFGTFGLWKSTTIASLAVAAIGALLVPYVPVAGWAGIVALVLAQQALVFVRAMLRVTALAAEVDYAGARGAGQGPAAAQLDVAQPALPFLGEGL